MPNKARERALESALFDLYQAWARLPIAPGYKRRYYATKFLQTILPKYRLYKGGVRAVKDVLGKRTIGAGRLKHYPHLTVEHLVLSGKWDDLFDETYRKLARRELREQGYSLGEISARLKVPKSTVARIARLAAT